VVAPAFRAALFLAAALTAPASSGVADASQSAAAAATLSAGGAVRQELSAGVVHRYRIDLRQGEAVRVSIEPHGIDAGAALLGPDRARLFDVPVRHGGAIALVAVARMAGAHHLEVRAVEAGPATGRYEVRLQDVRPAAPADSSRAAASRLLAEAETLLYDWQLSSTDAALERYRRALASWKAAGDVPEQAFAAKRIGEILHAVGRPDEAVPHLLLSLRLARAAADARAECDALNGAARVYLDLGRLDEADRHADLAQRLSRETQNPGAEADALNVLGDIYAFSGRSVESVDVYERALAIAVGLADRRRQALARLNLGHAYADLSRVADAHTSYESALLLSRAVADRRGQAAALTGLIARPASCSTGSAIGSASPACSTAWA
jgi:tetratricopeptide (TPR) repeat protein